MSDAAGRVRTGRAFGGWFMTARGDVWFLIPPAAFAVWVVYRSVRWFVSGLRLGADLWIPAEELLPRAHGLYLVYSAGPESRVGLAFYTPGGGWGPWVGPGGRRVTHWLLIPEPPGGGDSR